MTATIVTGFSSVKGTLLWTESSFKRTQEATQSDCQLRHVRPTVKMQQLGCDWKQLDKISHWDILLHHHHHHHHLHQVPEWLGVFPVP